MLNQADLPAALGWARSAAHVAGPAALPALRVALEREAAQRGRRLAAATRERARDRLRPRGERMRAVQVRPGGRFAWRSLPAPPPPGRGAAVVRPLAIATCDMDRPIALGATPFAMPFCFGHESVVEVVAVGADVARVRPGERAVLPFQISCGACVACRDGRTANCLRVPPISMYGFGVTGGHWGGVIADVVAVPFADGMLVPLPESVEPAAAASVADNVSDAYRHVAPHLPALLERDADAEVLVVAGLSRRHLYTASVPLYTALIARALGARHVVLADARREIRAQAARLGIEAVAPGEAARRPPAPLVVDASGSPRGLRLALRRTAPDGVCSCAGGLAPRVGIPFTEAYGRNVTLHVARAHARAIIPRVLELMADGSLRPETVTAVTAGLDDAPAALREHVRAGHTKTVLVA